jgi:hypothetical protein
MRNMNTGEASFWTPNEPSTCKTLAKPDSNLQSNLQSNLNIHEYPSLTLVNVTDDTKLSVLPAWVLEMWVTGHLPYQGWSVRV